MAHSGRSSICDNHTVGDRRRVVERGYDMRRHWLPGSLFPQGRSIDSTWPGMTRELLAIKGPVDCLLEEAGAMERSTQQHNCHQYHTALDPQQID